MKPTGGDVLRLYLTLSWGGTWDDVHLILGGRKCRYLHDQYFQPYVSRGPRPFTRRLPLPQDGPAGPSTRTSTTTSAPTSSSMRRNSLGVSNFICVAHAVVRARTTRTQSSYRDSVSLFYDTLVPHI